MPLALLRGRIAAQVCGGREYRPARTGRQVQEGHTGGQAGVGGCLLPDQCVGAGWIGQSAFARVPRFFSKALRPFILLGAFSWQKKNYSEKKYKDKSLKQEIIWNKAGKKELEAKKLNASFKYYIIIGPTGEINKDQCIKYSNIYFIYKLFPSSGFIFKVITILFVGPLPYHS